ncbi:MAG: SUMF1/EgtB/PvdO family nonheme iron enzyme, partial [bacterium]|nr:SUMF1/EgtB/PvdO family nonheme iron enzyme [bacterium]
KSAIKNSDLKGLAERPLIMTVMALLHTSHGQLPEDRVELYQWTVDLLFRRWKGDISQGGKGLMATLDMPQLKMSDLVAGLYHVAFRAHAGQGGTSGAADIAEETLLKQLKPYLGDDWNRAEAFIRYVRERSGLLIRHKTDAYTFPHRTFQEFMAACHLTGLKDYPREAARLVRENPDPWRIVYVLAAGNAARTQLGNAISSVGKLCVRSVMEMEAPDAAAFKSAVIAGEALLEIGLAGVKREEDGRAILDRVRQWLVTAMTADGALNAVERAEAGNVLDQLGDPRFDPENWYLPDDGSMGFVEIPAGKFFMGEGSERHEVDLSPYAISKYPVTAAQYKAFAKDVGREQYEDWDEYNRWDNHPAVVVSWDDALAYCEWLSEKLKDDDFFVTLPTEAQWEKAARGTDERRYPWGNNEIDPKKANYDETGIGGTSPVGCFPKDKSPYDAFDMAGNVLEWCMDSSDYGFETDTYVDGLKDPVCKKGAYRVVRGGAWGDGAESCRAAYRRRGAPDDRFQNLGFRLVRLPGQLGEPDKSSQ